QRRSGTRRARCRRRCSPARRLCRAARSRAGSRSPRAPQARADRTRVRPPPQSVCPSSPGEGCTRFVARCRGCVVNRCVLVTGAARGIGAAIAERLAADGWLVHGVDIEDADLTTREGNRAVVDAALERFDGRLDAVVANAGFQHVAPLREFPEEQWEKLQALLVTSPFLLAKYAWDALAASGDGRFLV